MHDLADMAVDSEPIPCVIDDERSLGWRRSYLISGFRCVLAPIDRVASSRPLLGHRIDIREEFRRDPCRSVGTVSFGEGILYAQIHIPDRDDIPLL